MLKTKLSILKEHMAAGDHRAALKLAAGWWELGEHKEAITRGWAALSSPAIYRQMGKDPDGLVMAGIEAIRERYGIVEEATAK